MNQYAVSRVGLMLFILVMHHLSNADTLFAFLTKELPFPCVVKSGGGGDGGGGWWVVVVVVGAVVVAAVVVVVVVVGGSLCTTMLYKESVLTCISST